MKKKFHKLDKEEEIKEGTKKKDIDEEISKQIQEAIRVLKNTIGQR